MDGLILHPTTGGQVAHFLATPTHAVLLVGPDGIGKSALATALAARVLEVARERLASYPHYRLITPGPQGNISIEEVRQIQKFLQLKTAGDRPFRRVVIIEHAQGLTTEAQNAYLKMLEEPPADTLMVLTANSPRALLPTIASRVQTITIHTPSETQLQGLLDASGKDQLAARQAYFLSGGLPGLLHALLKDQEHPLASSVAQAKLLLQEESFERLARVDGLSKQKEAAVAVVAALERIALTGLSQAAGKGDTVRIKRWHHIRKTTVEAREMLAHSASTKLTLTSLFLQL